MRIAIISDIHLVSENDPFTAALNHRSHFALAWPSFDEMIRKINQKSPDMNIFLGDVVDWCSDENIKFAMSMIEKLKAEFHITPGNHDFEMYELQNNKIAGPISAMKKKEQAKQIWQRNNISFDNRIISDGKTGVILVDSATSGISNEDADWLKSAVSKYKTNIVFTHTPFDLPDVRKSILAVDPNKNLTKYVQSQSPDIFANILKDKTNMIFTGHLHFPIELTVDGTRMLSLPLSIKAVGRNYLEMGQATILDTDKLTTEAIRI